MPFSPSTLALFQQLLSQVQIHAMQPDFDEVVAQVSLAKAELRQAIESEGS